MKLTPKQPRALNRDQRRRVEKARRSARNKPDEALAQRLSELTSGAGGGSEMRGPAAEVRDAVFSRLCLQMPGFLPSGVGMQALGMVMVRENGLSELRAREREAAELITPEEAEAAREEARRVFALVRRIQNGENNVEGLLEDLDG